MYVIFEWFHVAVLILIQKSEEKLTKKNNLEKDDKARKVTYDIPLNAMCSVPFLDLFISAEAMDLSQKLVKRWHGSNDVVSSNSLDVGGASQNVCSLRQFEVNLWIIWFQLSFIDDLAKTLPWLEFLYLILVPCCSSQIIYFTKNSYFCLLY